MKKEEILLLTLVACFAALVTMHLALVVGLARRRPAWQALLAFAAVPLAPYWGFRSGLLLRSVVWVASALGYLALRTIAR